MGKYLLPVLATIQIAIITFLCIEIFNKKNNVLGEATINPIKNEDIIVQHSGDLQYYYEHKPNSVIDSYKPLLSNGKLNINSDSLNERFEYDRRKDDGSYRIITLGDSFTQGTLVNTFENWTEVLEDRLNQNMQCKNIQKFEVINLGVGGFDIEYAVHRFKIRGQKYNPDLIIWLTHPNDFQEIEEIKGPIVKKYKQELKNQNKYSGVEVSRQASYRAKMDFLDIYSPEFVRKYALSKMMDIDKYFSKKMLIMTISDISKEEKQVIDEFQETNQKSISTFVLPKYAENLTFMPHDAHPNSKGHAQISKDLYNHIIKNNMIPCNR